MSSLDKVWMFRNIKEAMAGPLISIQKRRQVLKLAINKETPGLSYIGLLYKKLVLVIVQQEEYYNNLVEDIAASVVRELYPDVSVIWQDDPASMSSCT